tara:strand:+ start:24668 stop:25795 length:1128 start_codon:yes stop_codon:yes gene_type:complete
MNLNNKIQQLHSLNESIWYDNISRQLIKSGQLENLVESGITGVTSNPSIFEKSISSSDAYDSSICEYTNEGLGPEEIFEKLAIADISKACDLLHSTYLQSNFTDGFASIEVNPNLAHDTSATIKAGIRIFEQINKPNVMIKVPATNAGIPAIRELISMGINVNVTLIFSLDSYRQVREAYISGLEDRLQNGHSISAIMSVASFFLSRVDTIVDTYLEELNNPDKSSHLLGTAAIANAKQAYMDFKTTFTSERFEKLLVKGGQIQRPLWASTSTKNPNYSPLLYVEELIGDHIINTMPDNTLDLFLKKGEIQETICNNLEISQSNLNEIRSISNFDEMTSQLLSDGLKQFSDSYNMLLEIIDSKSKDIIKSKILAD